MINKCNFQRPENQPFTLVVSTTRDKDFVSGDPFPGEYHLREVYGDTVAYLEWNSGDGLDVELTDEEVQFITEIIQTSGVKHVIFHGRNIASYITNSITSGKTLNSLMKDPPIESSELPGISISVTYHWYRLKSSSSDYDGLVEDSQSKYEQDVNWLLDDDNQINIETVQITNFNEYLEVIRTLNDSDHRWIGLDYETNGEEVLTPEFKITMIGLGVVDYVDERPKVTSWWYTVPHEGLTPNEVEILRLFFKKNTERLVAYNVSFEMKVTYHITGELFKFQDAMVMATMHNKRGSLKNLIRSMYGMSIWEAEVTLFRQEYESMVHGIRRDPELIEQVKNLDLQAISESENTSMQEFIKFMEESYSHEDYILALKNYPYPWGAVPRDVLGPYCAKDAGVTALVAYDLYTPCKELSYSFCIRHPWLAARFEINGFRWDDVEASKLSDELFEESAELLEYVALRVKMEPQWKEELRMLMSREIPFTYTYYEGVNGDLERNWVIDSYEEKNNLIKTFFNPNSNTADSRAMFWDVYGTDTIKIATIVLFVIESLELAQVMPDVYEKLGDGFMQDSTPQEIAGKLLSLSNDPKLGYHIKRCFAESNTVLDPKESSHFGRFSADCIKFQYQVHTKLLGMSIEDESTWSEEFRMLFCVFLWKKNIKTISTNIEGKNGRSCTYASLEMDSARVHMRSKPYWTQGDSSSDWVRAESDYYVNVPRFNSLAAASLRWQSGYHITPSGSPFRKVITPYEDDHVLIAADFSQAELVVLAFLSQDERMLDAFHQGRDMHRFVGSIVFNKPYDEVTSEERRAAKACSFGD